MSNKTSRRGVLAAMATVGGGLLLRSLATGLPAKILLDPLSARADDMPTGRMLILSSSSSGDPVNANVPGTYVSGIFHSADALMAPTSMNLGGQQFTAAKPWALLPQAIRDRTCFFHHATYTPVHGEMNRVQRMMDATEKNDMLISLISRELAAQLGTVQSDPVSLGARGGELLSSGGRILSNVAPLSVRRALGGVEGPLQDLQDLRDESIDKIYALYKEQGTPSQQRLLDAWVRSRDEVRNISTDLVSRLDAIDGNDQVNQARTAAVLAAMKIAPVLTMHLDFGGDNHSDAGFDNETTKHQTAIATMQLLIEELDQLRAGGQLQHDVIFGSLNVFGRTLKRKGTAGRDHHSGHHCMVLSGPGIKPGVVGGLVLNEGGTEFIANSIDSATGASGGDIPYEETLGAAGKTLAVALGITEERANQMLPVGKVVQSAIA
jgi:uncharacterized protein DUF1501